MKQKFRHELKHEINYLDYLTVRQNLSVIASLDKHAEDGAYKVRSLYFDNLYDKALRENLCGVDCREKFRIRYYNNDTSVIHLEKKSKISGLCSKLSAPLTVGETQKIMNGDLAWMRESGHALVVELYSKILSQGLRPAVIVDYMRIPYVYGPGNVRVTLDSDIRTCRNCAGFLDPEAATIPAGDSAIILEVKWDEFLPDNIRHACELQNRRPGAFSKYSTCRIYG